MEKHDLLLRMEEAITRLDAEMARAIAEQSLELGLDPLESIEKGFSKGMKVIGDKFEKLECYLPELIGAAQAFKIALDVLEPEIARRKQTRALGIVVLGTVKGDIHKIGKDIVGLIMKLAGYQVYDLGEDVPASKFVQMAAKYNADIIAMSALLTTTMPVQKEVIDILTEDGERDMYIVMVGGAPVDEKWAKQIKADAYAATAEGARAIAAAKMKERQDLALTRKSQEV